MDMNRLLFNGRECHQGAEGVYCMAEEVRNQRGAVILMVLMTLALMMIIGISAIRMSAFEALSIRNVGIYKQNLHLVESAAVEGVQRIVDMEFDGDVSDLDPRRTTQSWIQDDEDWEMNREKKWCSASSSGPVLNAGNSTAPECVMKGSAANNVILLQRGEFDTDNRQAAFLRYAFVGWNPAHGCTLKATAPARRAGRILAEYASDRYGILRLEVGVERKF
jgi:hypothetical protein